MHTLSSAHNSFEAWNQALRQVCGRFESQPALNRTLFIGDISRQDLGGLELAQIRTNAGRIARQATMPIMTTTVTASWSSSAAAMRNCARVGTA